ncbi:MAG: hypothetical protein ACO1SX_12235 [Actinomycetota bacterium]
MLGAQQDPYLLSGEWQLFASYRHLRSDRHFSGTVEQVDREKLGNFVVNKQYLLDLGATYAVNRQFNVTLGIPILTYGSWAVPLPVNPPGTRRVQSADGLGDITLVGRYWLLDCETKQTGNFALGLGVKLPTGDYGAKDKFQDITGGNAQVKPVDISIQPGDGGFGIILDGMGFQKVGSATAFASATYLINPRNTNGTPSIISNLFGGNVPASLAGFAVNSVPDQYLARVGAALPIKGVKGLSVSLAARIEGVPPDDLIGGSDGWRRPGYAIFVEPGLIYSQGRHTWSISAPVATQRNRQANVQGLEGDATFADYFIVASYSYRQGGRRKGAVQKPAAEKPTSQASCKGCRHCRPTALDAAMLSLVQR